MQNKTDLTFQPTNFTAFLKVFTVDAIIWCQKDPSNQHYDVANIEKVVKDGVAKFATAMMNEAAKSNFVNNGSGKQSWRAIQV